MYFFQFTSFIAEYIVDCQLLLLVRSASLWLDWVVLCGDPLSGASQRPKTTFI